MRRDTRDHLHTENPQRALWQAILQTAVDDALTGSGGGTDTRERRLDMIHEARAYLTTPSADLTIVCLNAGLDPTAVIEHMTRRIAAAPSPQELVAAGALASRLAQKAKVEPKQRPTPLRLQPFTVDGITRTAEEWAASIGITVNALYHRITVLKWPVERACTLSREQAAYLAQQERRVASAMNAAKGRKRRQTWTRGSPAKTLTHGGETLTLAEWSERLGIKPGTIASRLRKGLTVEQALIAANLRGKPLHERFTENEQDAA